MRTIIRSQEPACLERQPRGQDWHTFMATPCHHELHRCLQEEQKGLCCYCELNVQHGGGHIEHMEPRSYNPARIYDYSNLAFSCNGGHGEHCGHFKDNRSGHTWEAGRFLSPHDPATATSLQYLIDGSIEPTDKNRDKASYLISYLGLDCPRLTDRRRAHARRLIDTLGEQPDLELIDWLHGEYLQPASDGRLAQFYSLSSQILEP